MPPVVSHEPVYLIVLYPILKSGVILNPKLLEYTSSVVEVIVTVVEVPPVAISHGETLSTAGPIVLPLIMSEQQFIPLRLTQSSSKGNEL